jgi:hypothetical protein
MTECVTLEAAKVEFHVARCVRVSLFPETSLLFSRPLSTPIDRCIVGGRFSTACYIEDSFPSLLYLAYKYADDPEAALIANTNVGGENCHRCDGYSSFQNSFLSDELVLAPSVFYPAISPASCVGAGDLRWD